MEANVTNGMPQNYRNGNSEEIEIDLGEVFFMLLHFAWLIALSALLAGSVGFLISRFAITPMYESSTTVWIVNKNEENTNLAYADLQLGSVLTKDYAELIKSRTVLEKVIENLGLDDTYGSFSERVSVTNKTDTRILVISVKDPDPIQAQLIDNELRDTANEHILEVTDVEAVNVSDPANLPTEPVSPKVLQWTIIGAAIGAFLSIVILLLRFLLDDTIKTSEDVERYVGLSTLGMIPTTDTEEATKEHSRRRHHKHSDEESLPEVDYN
jgi:capsular polysaccharide biosynthesis protein